MFLLHCCFFIFVLQLQLVSGEEAVNGSCHTRCLVDFSLCKKEIGCSRGPDLVCEDVPEREITLGCARTSALCRQQCRQTSGEEVPPFQEENVVDTVTGDLVKGAPEGAILLKPAKGLHRVGSNGEALPIFPFGFYQYGIDQDLEKVRRGE